MSNELSKRAYANFTTANRSLSRISGVTLSGNIPLSTILDVAANTHAGLSFTTQGLTGLSMSIQHIEIKLNAIMTKLGIPIAPVP